MDAIEWKYYILYLAILGVDLVVVYLTYVETSGRTLDEVAEVFGESINDIGIGHLKSKATVQHAEDSKEAEDSSSTGDKAKDNMLA